VRLRDLRRATSVLENDLLKTPVFYMKKNKAKNVVCMFLHQFSGYPLYIPFLLLFLFFIKHKQNKKRNIIREEIE
jgi:hypothetical protein